MRLISSTPIRHFLLPGLAVLCVGIVWGGAERTNLYTKPDPASPGGITGRVARPPRPIEQILAIPYDAPEKVYEGEVSGSDRRSFQFSGLPMRKYDLVVIFENSFYEGVRLNRGENTLTDADREKIAAIIKKSEPYFPEKIIHRVEGQTGRGNTARCICTFFRAKGSELMWEKYKGQWKRDDFRRTFKLVILKDVGPGWQVVRMRDLYPAWVAPHFIRPKHHCAEVLSGIRVADKMKDLGELDLGETRNKKPEVRGQRSEADQPLKMLHNSHSSHKPHPSNPPHHTTNNP